MAKRLKKKPQWASTVAFRLKSSDQTALKWLASTLRISLSDAMRFSLHAQIGMTRITYGKVEAAADGDGTWRVEHSGLLIAKGMARDEAIEHAKQCASLAQAETATTTYPS